MGSRSPETGAIDADRPPSARARPRLKQAMHELHGTRRRLGVGCPTTACRRSGCPSRCAPRSRSSGARARTRAPPPDAVHRQADAPHRGRRADPRGRRRAASRVGPARPAAARGRALAPAHDRRRRRPDRLGGRVPGERPAAAAQPDPRRAQDAAAAPEQPAGAPTASCSSSSSRPVRTMAITVRKVEKDTTMTDSVFDPVRIGIVSISDRASSGVYADQGLPALQDWLSRAAQPDRLGDAADPGRRGGHRADAVRARRHGTLRPRSDHRRHRPGAARRDARGDAGRRRQGDARLRRADAPDQPALRADGDPVAPGR